MKKKTFWRPAQTLNHLIKCGLYRTSQIDCGSVLSEAASMTLLRLSPDSFTLFPFKKHDPCSPSCDSVVLVFLVLFITSYA